MLTHDHVLLLFELDLYAYVLQSTSRRWPRLTQVSRETLMTSMNLDWERFLSGHWVRTLPTQLGEYPTRTTDGHAGPNIYVVRHKKTGSYFSVPHTPSNFSGTQWGGWFWSEPIPKNYGLPPIPDLN